MVTKTMAASRSTDALPHRMSGTYTGAGSRATTESRQERHRLCVDIHLIGFMNEPNVAIKAPPTAQIPAVQKVKVFPKPEIKRLKVPPLKPTSEPNQ